MAFDDLLFPPNYSRNAQIGPSLSASPVTTPGGFRQVVQNMEQPLQQWTVAKRVKNFDEIKSLYNYYLGRRGIVNTFPIWDPIDNKIDRAAMAPEFGDGVVTDFQIVQRYEETGNPLIRTVVLPVLATLAVYRDGVLEPAGNYTANRGTGIVAFAAAPGAGERVTASCDFHFQAHFKSQLAIFDMESIRLGSWNGIEIEEERGVA